MAKKRKSKSKKKSSGKKLDPRRFQKQDENSLFSFDPIRRDLFKWGLVAGVAGGFFMVRQDSIIWSIVGIAIVVFVSNYHISRASQKIPRVHATVMSFLGVFIGMFGTIIIGTVILAYLQGGEGNG